MTIEIEAKMRVGDLASLQRRLEAVGATRGEDVIEINTFFDTPEGRLKAVDQGLRIRIERSLDGSRSDTIITHKGPRAHGRLKSRMETELHVADGRDAADLLGVLGYVQVLSFEKRRSKWEYEDCLIAVDVLPYLGTYLEIEGPSDEAVLTAREQLGLTDVPLIRASYIALLKDYVTEHHISDTFIRLESEAAAE